MRYVQLVLTESQVALAARAFAYCVTANDDDEEKGQLGQLADFFYAVEANPAAFPVKSPEMARAIKKRMSRIRGAAQPALKAKKVSQGKQKRTRAQKREEALAYNEALQAELEARAIEEAQAERERIAASGIILPGQE